MEKNNPYASLRYKEFRWFLLIRFALVFAWSMQFVVVEWEVYRLTNSKLALGYIGLAEVIAITGMSLFSGPIVDRSEKRNLLVKSLAGFGAISLALFLLTWSAVVGDWNTDWVLVCIYVLVFCGGIVRSFIGPTVFSLMGLIVPKAVYPNAATWTSSIWQLGSILGASLAGIFIYVMGVHWSMCLIFGAVLIALLCCRFITVKPLQNAKVQEPVLKSFREGLHFVFTNKVILGVIALDMFAVLFGGAVALLPVYAKDILQVGSEGFGVLRAAPAIGALVTMAISAYVPMKTNTGKKLLTAVFLFGLSIILFGVSTNFWLSVTALFLSGMADGVSVVIRQTILQLRTPDHMRGRVAAVNSIFISSSNEFGAFESGFTAWLMGTVPAVVFGGCMTLFTVLGMGAAIPALRKLDLHENRKDAES